MDATAASLVCPKCGEQMRTYERSGMHIEQCTGCRGVFLDRGELERLIDAESNYYSGPRRGADRYGDDDDDEDWGRSGRRGRRGFLGGLFEGGDD